MLQIKARWSYNRDTGQCMATFYITGSLGCSTLVGVTGECTYQTNVVTAGTNCRTSLPTKPVVNFPSTSSTSVSVSFSPGQSLCGIGTYHVLIGYPAQYDISSEQDRIDGDVECFRCGTGGSVTTGFL